MKTTLPWGIHSVPKDEWLDLSKQYLSNGLKVENLKLALHDSQGKENMFPIKGNIVLSSGKTKKIRKDAWTLNGLNTIFGPNKWDLKEE